MTWLLSICLGRVDEPQAPYDRLYEPKLPDLATVFVGLAAVPLPTRSLAGRAEPGTTPDRAEIADVDAGTSRGVSTGP